MKEQTPQNRKRHFPYLDTLRFLAFLSVFCYHSFIYKEGVLQDSFLFNFFYTVVHNGNTGVNLFYVLSGFLIFYLLLDEQLRTENLRIGTFYIKRILRIWPLYIICIVYGFFLYPIIKKAIHEPFVQNHHLSYYLTFTNNFETEKRFPNCFFLSVLWSIAVEFQFYLLAPFIVKCTYKKIFPQSMIALIVISLIFRIFYVNNYPVLYFNTLSVMSDFAIGGLAAYILLFKPTIVQSLTKNSFVNQTIVGITLILMLAQRQLFQLPSLIIFERLIIGTGLAFIIIILVKPSYQRDKPSSLLEKQGKYTYGFYCFHIIAITSATFIYDKLALFRGDLPKFLVIPILAFGLVLIMGYSSYHLFEKHFLKLKKRKVVI